MAIAFDNLTNSGIITIIPGTFSHTTSGTNRLLLLFIEGDFAGDNVSAASYNGVAMTLAVKAFQNANRWGYIYILANPASGANTVSITNAGAANAFLATAVSYTGAAQTGQPDNSIHVTGGASTSFAASITTIANNAWIAGFTQQNGGAIQTAGSGTILRSSNNGDSYSISDSNGPKTPAGTGTLNFTTGSSSPWDSLLVSFSPALTATANSGFFFAVDR